ncbi:MAG: helix-turn-helix transcriptional regulator, partial [Phycisphaerales bacterium JB039]
VAARPGRRRTGRRRWVRRRRSGARPNRPRASGGRGLSEEAARAYARLLGVDWAWLLTGAGEPNAAAPSDGALGAPPPNAEGEALDLPAAGAMPRSVPVRGTAVCGDDGDFEFNGEVVDYVRRPPGIAAARNIFAIYVTGDSMAPRFEAGELVFVHPDRPPVSGCDVLVELHGHDGQPGACYIKRLLRRTPTKLVLRQFNPPRDDIEFGLEQIRVLYRILTPSELMGV